MAIQFNKPILPFPKILPNVKDYTKVNLLTLASRFGFNMTLVPYISKPGQSIMNPDIDQESKYTYLGTPVGNRYMTLRTKNPEIQPNISTRDGDFFEMILLAPFIDVSYTKNVISTPISGFRTPVKEVISGNDYELTIKGTLATDYAWSIPEDEMIALNRLLFECSFLEIQNYYLQIVYGINTIIPTSWDFAMHDRLTNVVMYTITAYGDIE